MTLMRAANEAAEPTNVPSQKTLAATGGSAVGSALATILLYWLDPSSQLPPEVRTAVTVLISAAFTFLAGYITPPSSKEAVVKSASGKVMLGRVA